MQGTGRPLAIAGAALSLVSGALAVSASLDAQAGSGRFPVGAHDGMAPGSVPALLFLVGLFVVGIGAAVHDGKELRRPAALPPTSTGRSPRAVPRPVRSASHPVRSAPHPVRTASRPVRGRRTSSGTRLEVVGAARRR
ncbi:hypothetical protein ABEG17_09860 [Pedococcus sp. KACC 23699]|uniref:Uncharacterized protein n=1 Tax=Pedococcus sp. KACC 23699 TaxID=3149228 RepID=A0AAU7JNM1_9MICO